MDETSGVWSAINRAFSEPVSRSDDSAEYAPTQLLAEAFRSRYDGIVYGSNVGSGKNIALFDPTAAELANCRLCRVEAVKLEFEEASDPYYTEKYGTTDEREGTSAASNEQS